MKDAASAAARVSTTARSALSARFMSRDTPYTGDYSVTYHYNDDAGNTSGLRRKAMERRDFIKMTGAAAAAAAATGIAEDVPQR